MAKEMSVKGIKQAKRPRKSFTISKPGALVLSLCILTGIHIYKFTTTSSSPFTHLSKHCANTSPISAPEFHDRQTSLARILHSLNASAYIAEPGPSAQYYANISASQWHLSERPLLLVISPEVVGEPAEVRARVSVLTPTFEATRAKLLPIPAESVGFTEWPEDANPYEIAASLIPLTGTVFVDESIRHFIVDGLGAAKPKLEVASAPLEIRRLRERKSPAEIDLLRCANEVTLLAMRAVHQKLYFGMRESEARRLMQNALSAAGLTNGDCLALFGENAALPHGAGTDRILGKSEFALFDCGGALHGYQSDITRTVALPDSTIPSGHLDIWHLVRNAQTIALFNAIQGALTRFPDESARDFLEAVEYGKYFTHRLGHGIGLEAHESPYLRGGSDDVIEIGHTFSDEPGIYIEGDVGVRLEDCFYIAETGLPVLLTAGVGGQARTPWEP